MTIKRPLAKRSDWAKRREDLSFSLASGLFMSVIIVVVFKVSVSDDIVDVILRMGLRAS